MNVTYLFVRQPVWRVMAAIKVCNVPDSDSLKNHDANLSLHFLTAASGAPKARRGGVPAVGPQA
jgi:hypothetical protein